MFPVPVLVDAEFVVLGWVEVDVVQSCQPLVEVDVLVGCVDVEDVDVVG
jgi:hypothetical protein